MLNIIEIYRIDEWWHYLGFIMIGFLLNSSFNLDLLKYLLLGSFLLAYAYSLNDYYDKKTKKYFILPLVLSLLFLTFLNFIQIILSLLFLIIFTLYSAKPIRFKSLPFVCTILNGIGFILLFFIGYFKTTLISNNIFFFLPLFTLEIVAQLIHEIIHMKTDLKEKIKTTAILLKETKIKKICIIFLISTSIYAIILFMFDIMRILTTILLIFLSMYFSLRIHHIINEKLRRDFKLYFIAWGLVVLIENCLNFII